MRSRAFYRYSIALLGFNLAVIAWGAFVRATGSGAGCGEHWPMCNGVALPRSPSVATVIELTHRVTSGLALLGVLLLGGWAFRLFPRGHLARRAAAFSVLFILTEAAIGAGLVLFKLVAHNPSMVRAAAMSLHLVNTFLLLGALTLTSFAARDEQLIRWRGAGRVAPLLWGALFAVLALGASGAIAALGDTLYPSASLAEGLAQDFSPSGLAPVTLLSRLRVAHPFLALGTAVYLTFVAIAVCALKPEAGVRRSAYALVGITVLQLFFGMVNLALLAPVWAQLIHLGLADAVWVALILFCAQACSEGMIELRAHR